MSKLSLVTIFVLFQLDFKAHTKGNLLPYNGSINGSFEVSFYGPFFFFVILQLDNFINPATLNLSLDKRFVETLPIRQTLIHRVDTPCQKEDSTVTKKLSASRAKTYVMKCSISLFCLKSLMNMFFYYLLGYRYIFAVQLWSKRIAEQKWIWGLYHCLPASTSCSSTVNFHRFRLQVGLVFVYFQTNASHVSGWRCDSFGSGSNHMHWCVFRTVRSHLKQNEAEHFHPH